MRAVEWRPKVELPAWDPTTRVGVVLRCAQAAALRLGHERLGVEHLTLGLIDEGEGIAAAVLVSLRVDGAALKARICDAAPRPTTDAPFLTEPYRPTPRLAIALCLGHHEQRALGHGRYGTHHLLLGAVLAKTFTASVLGSVWGVDAFKVRRAVRDLCGGHE